MNGFANAILSLLLGWLKSLINGCWRLLNSDSGGSFLAYLSQSWKTWLIVLCVGGFVIDRLVYLFRWRPYYVWQSRLHRRRGLAPEQAPAELSAPPVDMSAYQRPEHGAPYAPPYAEEAPRPVAPDDLYAPPYAEGAPQPVVPNDLYAPPYAEGTPRPVAPNDLYAPPVSVYGPDAYQPPVYEPEEPLEPLYDEAPAWPESEPTRIDAPAYPETAPTRRYQDFAPLGKRNPAQGMVPQYGAAQPEPPSYFQDVQNGYAPPPTPEELYRKRSEPILTDEPVHPGLDPAVFRENLGITESELRSRATAPKAPTFTPFTEAETEEIGKRHAGLSALAQKARSFVGGVDDLHPPTIHDLQTTVDRRNAFHAPVYPKQPFDNGEEDK